MNRERTEAHEGVLTDCFAYGGTRCRALIEMVCRTGKCPFYKVRSAAPGARDLEAGCGIFAGGEEAE